MIPFFEEFASEMLQQGGLTPQEALARCMVAMTGRQLTVHRSVLTGQTGMTTILAEARDPFREFDLFEHVRSLYDGDDRIHIPQVSFLWNKPNAAVFDLQADKAKLILAKVRPHTRTCRRSAQPLPHERPAAVAYRRAHLPPSAACLHGCRHSRRRTRSLPSAWQ